MLAAPHRMPHAPRSLAAAVAATLACDGDAPPPPAPRGAPLYACTPCPDGAARVPDGRGDTACVAVGASPEPTPDDPRALLPELPAPIVYVAAGGPDGDGSRARPFPSLARALVAQPTGTLVLLAGRHVLAAPVEARGPLALVGAGVAATTLVAPAGTASVRAPSPAAALTLARLTLDGGAPALEARDGARAALRDVRVAGAATALFVGGAATSVDAQGLTVTDARGDCIVVEGGASLSLRASLLRRCGGYGVRARAEAPGGEGGRVALSRALVDGARGYGVALTGDDAGDGAPCAEGARGCLRELSVRDVAGVGVGVVGRRAAAVWRSLVCGARAEATGATGDGLYVAAGARVSIDDELPVEGAASLGRGSWIVANARAGVLVERTRPEAPEAPETVLALRGAVVSSNGGPGIVLQRGAAARAIDHARVEDNGGLGLGLTPGTRVDQILCDQFVATRPAVLQTEAGPFRVADGLSMGGASAGRVDDNVFSDNARFGVVFGDSDAVLTGNRGRDNLYGVGNYAAAGRVRIDAPSAIAGRLTAPAARPPIVTGAR